MDAFAHMQMAGQLFADDFDMPEAAPAPVVIEPVFSAHDLTAAREAAWRDGHAAGLKEIAEGDAAATRQAITAIAEQFAAERDEALARAEVSAEAITQLLLGGIAAVFPAMCAQYGDAEVRSIVRIVLPALTQEQVITVRTHPRTAKAMAREIARLDPELAAHVETVECDAMSPGDVRIAWRAGSATRDTAALWEQVAAVLMPAGLLRTDAAIRETVDGG